MTKKKTGHHYVPNKSYLANFADSSGKVWVLDATDKIFSTNPTNIFKEQHFYTINLKGAGESLVVEDTLANIEGDFAGIYRQKITDLVPLSIEEKARVSIFLGALHLRTKSQREGLHGALEQLHSGMKEWRAIFENNQAAREFSAKTMPTGGESIRLDDVEDALANIGQLHSTSMMDNLPEISQLIFEMDWQYLPAAAGMTFVTSSIKTGGIKEVWSQCDWKCSRSRMVRCGIYDTSFSNSRSIWS